MVLCDKNAQVDTKLSHDPFLWSPNFGQPNEHFGWQIDQPNDEQIILYYIIGQAKMMVSQSQSKSYS